MTRAKRWHPIQVDVLADVLRTTDLGAELFFRASLSGRFAIAVPEDSACIRFHVAGEGHTWIGLESGESVLLAPGDLALIPNGRAHWIADSEASARNFAQPLADVLAAADPANPGTLVYGEGSRRSTVVCGKFECAGPGVHPIFERMPPLIHRSAEAAGDFVWMDHLLDHLDAETKAQRPGHTAVAQRLAEIVFIEVLRRFVADPGSEATGLGALGDPSLLRAIEAMHRDPAAAWSLNEIARYAGLSRSVLTERFRQRLGCSPMRYLARWRMACAAKLLRTEALSVGEVARAVGYGSESAFSRAFREVHGVAPGRIRHTDRATV